MCSTVRQWTYIRVVASAPWTRGVNLDCQGAVSPGANVRCETAMMSISHCGFGVGGQRGWRREWVRETPGGARVSLWPSVCLHSCSTKFSGVMVRRPRQDSTCLIHSGWLGAFLKWFSKFSHYTTIWKVWAKAALSKAWEIASLLFNLRSDWGIFPTGAKGGFSWLHPSSHKQQLGSFDPIIATNLQVALSRPEISYDFLLAVYREFRKGNMMSLWPPRLPWEPQLNAELISFFEQ